MIPQVSWDTYESSTLAPASRDCSPGVFAIKDCGDLRRIYAGGVPAATTNSAAITSDLYVIDDYAIDPQLYSAAYDPDLVFFGKVLIDTAGDIAHLRRAAQYQSAELSRNPFCKFATKQNSTSTQIGLLPTTWVLDANEASVFNNADLLGTISTEIRKIRLKCGSLKWRHTNRLIERFKALHSAAEEEGTDGDWISEESLAHFLRFLATTNNLVFPEIALTPDRNIYARWKSDRRKTFSTQFMPNGDVKFIVFKPNQLHENKVIRLAGSTTADALFDEITSQRIDNWIFE